MAINDGGPAFPRPVSEDTRNGTLREGNEVIDAQHGMSLRDYFAAKAMHAEFVTTFSDTTPQSAEIFLKQSEKRGHTPEQHLAFNAYKVADAMLAERRKGA